MQTNTPSQQPRPTPRGTGPGQAPWFNCGACTTPKPRAGSGMRLVLGLRCRVCSGCKQGAPK
jgi:hypothetical protein